METNEERKNNGEDGDEEKPSAMIHERNGKYDVFVTVPVACLPDRKRPPTEVGGKPRGKHKKAKGTRETEEEADVRVVITACDFFNLAKPKCFIQNSSQRACQPNISHTISKISRIDRTQPP